MRKTKIFVLVLIASMCVLTACGNKTEEEKAIEEIQSGFEEGLEKDEEIKSEADEFIGNRGEVFDKLNETELPALKEAWDTYMSATNVDDLIKAAEDFNERYDETLKLTESGVITEIEIENAVYNHVNEAGRIPEWRINAFRTWEDASELSSSRLLFGIDTDTHEYLFFFINDDTINGTVVKDDGSSCKIDINLNNEFPNNQGVYLQSLDKERIIFYIVTPEYTQDYYSVDISGNTNGKIDSFEYNFEELFDIKECENTIESVRDVLQDYE